MNTAATPVLRATTPTFAHHSVEFSPFFETRLALASGANYGLLGNGRLHVLELGPGGLSVVKWFDTQDCVYDVAWNESHENQIIAACGNGALRLFDVSLEGLPIKAWHEHSAEIMSVEWNNLQKEMFATASWDESVKIWNIARSTSFMTLPANQGQIYAASWCPNMSAWLATTGADGFLNIFDLRAMKPERPQYSVKVSQTDVLDLDWNKYDQATLAVAGKDGTVGVWDMRGVSGKPVGELRGHRLAVRKVAWSPHQREVVASTSYDMTCRTWNINTLSETHTHSQHSEFVMGAAWSLFDQGLLASCSWDEEVHLYRV